MNNFCTITTASHLFKTFALADSLVQSNATIHILVIDDYKEQNHPQNSILYPLSFIEDELAKKLLKKYIHNKDKLRWAMKAAFLKQLLEKFDKVIYTDNDIYFFSNASFLFDELNTNNVLLTPHFYSSNPLKEQNWLEANFRVGLYNAGFFAVKRDAVDVLDWWMNCCLYNIKKSFWRGLFDDQKYLDLIPVLFDKVKIVKHKGCNAAGWNYRNYTITGHENNIKVNGQAVVFIHFADLSMDEFSKQSNPFYPLYSKYTSALIKHNKSYTYRKKIDLYRLKAFLYYLKWRILRLFNK